MGAIRTGLYGLWTILILVLFYFIYKNWPKNTGNSPGTIANFLNPFSAGPNGLAANEISPAPGIIISIPPGNDVETYMRNAGWVKNFWGNWERDTGTAHVENVVTPLDISATENIYPSSPQQYSLGIPDAPPEVQMWNAM